MANGSGTPPSIANLRDKRRRDSPAIGLDAEMLAQIVTTQSEIAGAGLDPKKIVDIVTRRMQEMTRSAGAVVEIAIDDEMTYWSASGSAKPHEGLRLPIDGSLSGLCVKLGTVLRCDDSDTDPRVNRAACRKVGLRSAIVVPLQCAGTTVGVLKVLSPQPAAYDSRDVAILEMFSTFIGTSLHHALEHARLRAQLDANDVARNLRTRAHEALRERVRALIDGGHFVNRFQPIVDLRTRKIVGVEGLTRFDAATGDTRADAFEEAARAGLGTELELACVRRILLALPRIPPDAYLSINVSPATVVLAAFEEVVASNACERIVVELTEHAEVLDYAALIDRVAALRGLGLRFAIDDAGAGFASLRHVLRLVPEIIKMDVSLTHEIDVIARKRQLAAAIAMFARDSGATLVAEGVETAGELETLVALGVPCGQGYLLGWPAPLDALSEYLR